MRQPPKSRSCRESLPPDIRAPCNTLDACPIGLFYLPRSAFRTPRSLLFWLQNRPPVIAIHARDEFEADFLGAHGFAGARDGAIAKTFRVHLADHVEGAALAFGLALRKQTKVGNFGRDKKH